MKIVVNKCFGGFWLSKKDCEYLGEMPFIYNSYNRRTDERLVKCVESLGHDASDKYANIVIVDIPDNATDYRIEEYDGREKVLYVIDGKIYDA